MCVLLVTRVNSGNCRASLYSGENCSVQLNLSLARALLTTFISLNGGSINSKGVLSVLLRALLATDVQYGLISPQLLSK